MEDVEEMALRDLFAGATGGDEPPLGSLIEDAHRAAVATRRRRTVRATGGLAAAAALAAVIGASGALTGPGSAPVRVRTAAYVAARVQRAIATVNRVMHAEGTVTLPGGAGAGHVVTWAYHGRARNEQYRPGGWQLETDAGSAVVDGRLTGVIVTYHPDTWYRIPLDTVTGGPTTGCGAGALAVAGDNPPDWPSFIRAALRCGAATVGGRTEVGGVATIKINGHVTIPQGSGPGSARLRVRYTLYVNPATYLPVRMAAPPVLLRFQGGRGKGGPISLALTEDFQWLPPTAANVAKVSVPIPAGFPERKP
jgi:hypothetical protein